MKSVASALFVLGSVLWCSGCGSGGNSTGSGSGPTPPAQGSLTVTITGLPGGVSANVTVTGPGNFSQQLTSTETLQLAPGSYTITASPVTSGGSSYNPSTDTQTVTVTTTVPASITVSYAKASTSYSFVTIDYPGATATEPSGINGQGQISGIYLDGMGNQHGFIYTNGTFSSFDCPPDTTDPGAPAETFAYGINASGQVVGYCAYLVKPGDPQAGYIAEFGFLYSAGSFTQINYPGTGAGDLNAPFGINDSGEIIGFYEATPPGPEGDNQGFVYVGGTFSTIDYPGAADTNPQGVNGNGQIVGYASIYAVNGSLGIQPFLYSGGTFSALNIAGLPSSINDNGQIVGTSSLLSPEGVPVNSGFVYDGGSLVTLNFPNAQQTSAAGINDKGQIVGQYTDQSQHVHGFLAKTQ